MAAVNIASILAESAKRYPDKTAVVLGDMRIPYAAVWAGARRYAAVLRDQGIGPGDRVALLLPNTPHFPLAYYGALAVGATVVPVHALLVAEEIDYVLRDCDAKVLICAAPLLGEGAKGAELAGVPVLAVMDVGDSEVPRIDALAEQATPDDSYVTAKPSDEAVILYTSGTTGQPKGAVLTHDNILWNATLSATDIIKIEPDAVLLGCLPLFHSFGQVCAMNAGFRAGATLVLMPRFDGAGALDLLVRENVTIFLGVPTMYVGLLEAARSDPRRPSLKRAVSGGASLPVAVIERFKETFDADIYEGYGLSETSPVATFNQDWCGRKPGTVGCAIWGVDVEIARADVEGDIELLPVGPVGVIVIRGHNVFAGYLNRPDATAAVMVGDWFRSGDIGMKDEDGFISIVDRKKDLIIRGGFNVYPREVEEVLMRHPAVAQVAVVGAPDDTYGEEICAVAVLHAEAGEVSAEEVIAWSQEHLGRHKYPRTLFFVDSLPTGPSGKVLKREIVRKLKEGESLEAP